MLPWAMFETVHSKDHIFNYAEIGGHLFGGFCCCFYQTYSTFLSGWECQGKVCSHKHFMGKISIQIDEIAWSQNPFCSLIQYRLCTSFPFSYPFVSPAPTISTVYQSKCAWIALSVHLVRCGFRPKFSLDWSHRAEKIQSYETFFSFYGSLKKHF